MVDTRVTCPGCLRKVETNQCDHTRVGIDTESPKMNVSNSIFYCPPCGEKVAALDQAALVDNIIVLLRTMAGTLKAGEKRGH